MPPPVQLFLTTIASNVRLRQRQDYILRILQVKKIPFESFDLASDEKAKRLWKRKAPPANADLPGILVGHKWPGTFEQFEEAVEYNELDIFLRRNEDWNSDIEDDYGLVQQPIGVPGAYTPNQMTGQTASHAPEGSVPAPAVRPGEMDMGEHMSGFGLQGVKVTADDLADLVKSLGLDDDLADGLIGGLDFSSAAPTAERQDRSAPDSPPRPKPPKLVTGEEAENDEVGESHEEVDGDPDDFESGSDISDVGELPSAPRLRPGLPARKRTDERPLTSPLTPSSSVRSFPTAGSVDKLRSPSSPKPKPSPK